MEHAKEIIDLRGYGGIAAATKLDTSQAAVQRSENGARQSDLQQKTEATSCLCVCNVRSTLEFASFELDLTRFDLATDQRALVHLRNELDACEMLRLKSYLILAVQSKSNESV